MHLNQVALHHPLIALTGSTIIIITIYDISHDVCMTIQSNKKDTPDSTSRPLLLLLLLLFFFFSFFAPFGPIPGLNRTW